MKRRSNRRQVPASAVSRRSFLRSAAGTGLLLPLSAGGLGLVLKACTDGAGSDPGEAGDGEAADGVQQARYTTALGFTLSFIETMVAREQGFFEEQGLFIEILGGQGTATALQSVLGGSSQLSRANAINTTISIANEDAPLANIGTVRQRGQFEVVSLPEAPITSPDDLREGMTIGIVSAAGATENLLDLMLAQQGIDIASVPRPVTGVGPAGYELMRNGDVDGYISVNSDRATVEGEGNEVVTFNIYDFVDLPSDSYNCGTELIEAGDDRPARFLAGVLQAIEWASQEENWEEAIENLRVYNNEIDVDAALVEMPFLVEDWNASGEDAALQLDETRWGNGQDALAEIGLVQEPVAIDRLIYPDYLETARTMI